MGKNAFFRTHINNKLPFSEDPVVFDETLWEKSSGKILREHVKEYKKKPDFQPDIKFYFGFILLCVM